MSRGKRGVPMDTYLAAAMGSFDKAVLTGDDRRQQRLARGTYLSCAVSATLSLVRIAATLERMEDERG